MMIKRRQFPPSSAAECISAALLSVTVKEIERQRLRNFFINVGLAASKCRYPQFHPCRRDRMQTLACVSRCERRESWRACESRIRNSLRNSDREKLRLYKSPENISRRAHCVLKKKKKKNKFVLRLVRNELRGSSKALVTTFIVSLPCFTCLFYYHSRDKISFMTKLVKYTRLYEAVINLLE